MTVKSEGFYADLPRETVFGRLIDDGNYLPLPPDWLVGVSDIVGSTEHVSAGRYKTVNMAGAAIIAAVMNAHEGEPFPFVFGGDGASLAVRPDRERDTRAAMAAVARWVESEFAMTMRVALVPMSDIRAAGRDVGVARFQVSPGADYAMFSGGGLAWAEGRMKAGDLAIPIAPFGTQPDLTGLSCRWANMPSRNGTILSLVLAASPDADAAAVRQVAQDVIALAEGLERGGHPAPGTGMQARWAKGSAALEGHVTRGQGPLGAARRKAAFESAVYWLLHRLGLKVGGFDARRYARVVAANADFRKIDDGLKMTLDCDQSTRDRIEKVLKDAAAKGVIRYGTSTQDEAMMTCIVPSIMTDDHLHFIDGAAGGYTLAATRMKAG